MSRGSHDITQLLARINDGDRGAWESLSSRVYEELRRLARRRRGGEKGAVRFQTTELVNEAFSRLLQAESIDWNDRAHFFRASAEIMARILVDDARRRKAAKRGGGKAPLSIDDNSEIRQGLVANDAPAPPSPDVEALWDALQLLRTDKRLCRKYEVVNLHVFGGRTISESARLLGQSVATTERDWKFAKAWLSRELSGVSEGA